MNALPFLKNKRWPRMLGKMDTAHYGFSEDEELADKALDELFAAYEARDGRAFVRAFTALVHLVQMREEPADGHAYETT